MSTQTSFRLVDSSPNDVLPFDRLGAVADKLMELSKANHHRLV